MKLHVTSSLAYFVSMNSPKMLKANKRLQPSVIQQPKQQGFTLLELLLVIVIVAIMSAAVVITMNPDNTHRELEKEARRLTQVLRQLADESIFQGQEFGVSFDEEKYTFFVWNREENQWQAYEQPPVFRSYALPEPFIMVFDLG